MNNHPSKEKKAGAFDSPIYVTKPMLADLENYLPYFREIWNSHVLTNGASKHQALEAALADTLQVSYVKIFNNGTIALMAAFRVLGIFGEVITTPFTFPATPHALTWNGLTPVFCDIEKDSCTIDPAKIEKLITEKTSAILGVHVYGMPCNVERIQEIAHKHKLKVIYDAAHAFGTTYRGKSIGSFGDITMFSFHATKLFHTLEGGALTFTDGALSEQLDMNRNFGIRTIQNDMEVPIIGLNGKMNEVQAAVGLVNLKLVQEEQRKRASIRAAYIAGLSGIRGISVFSLPAYVTDSYQYFVIRIENECSITRDELQKVLYEYNVFSRKYFYPLCSEYACYSHLPQRELNTAQKVAEEMLCLPFYGALALPDVNRIVDIIRLHTVPA